MSKHSESRELANVLVVVRFAPFGELCQRVAERVHGLRELLGLVEGHRKLDMAEDEVAVQLRRLDVVIRSLFELVHDKEDYPRTSVSFNKSA